MTVQTDNTQGNLAVMRLTTTRPSQAAPHFPVTVHTQSFGSLSEMEYALQVLTHEYPLEAWTIEGK